MRKNKAIFITLCSALALGRHRSQIIDKQLPKNYQKILILSSGGKMGLAWQLATEELNIIKAKLWGKITNTKITNTKITIIRPTAS